MTDRILADCGIENLDDDGRAKFSAIVDGFIRQGGAFTWDTWCVMDAPTREVVKDVANRVWTERSAVVANFFWAGPKGIVEAVAALDGGKAKMHKALVDIVDVMRSKDQKPEGAA